MSKTGVISGCQADFASRSLDDGREARLKQMILLILAIMSANEHANIRD